MKKYKEIDIINRDNEGNVIEESFPVSKRTKDDQRKTSVGYSLVAFLLHLLAIVPLIAVSTVLAVKCYNLTPYYSFWCFVGVIIVGVFALIYAIVTLIVTRRRSKSSIASQTAKVAITFTCLTCVFSLLLTYIVPDIIEMATQNTMFVEDLYNLGESQAEKNAKLDRDFIMYNVLNGNLNDHSDAEHGDYSYKTLSKRIENEEGGLLFTKENGVFVGTSFYNAEINASFLSYLNNYKNVAQLKSEVIEPMAQAQPRKYELYQFIYNSYVLNDFDYAFYNDIHRPIIALSILDYEYAHSGYEALLKEGFKNKKLKDLFDKNFDSFNQDGYQTFDDPLLLYAQMSGRMTVPVVLRLILNEGWMHSQPVEDADGNVYFTDEGNCLYEIYDPATRDALLAAKGENAFTYTGTLMDRDGSEIEVKYGFNDEGWMVFENGVVKRPINWLVLDMDGNKMDLTTIDISGGVKSLIQSIMGAELPDATIKVLFNNILARLRLLFDSAGELLTDDLQGLIEEATNGANINIGLYIDDNDNLAINIYPMNTTYGMIGYAQASWVQSNNLLMAVINVVSLRNWMSIFGAIGLLLVIAAGIIRECGRRTRLRTEVSRDRIVRAKTAKKMKDGEPLQLNFEEEEKKKGKSLDEQPVDTVDMPTETKDETNNVFDDLFNTDDENEDASEETVNLDETELTTDEQTEPATEESIIEESTTEELAQEDALLPVEEPVMEESTSEQLPLEESVEQTEEFASEEPSNEEAVNEEPVEQVYEQQSGKKKKGKKKKGKGNNNVKTEEPVQETVEEQHEELPLEEVKAEEELTEQVEELPAEEQSEEPALEEVTEQPEATETEQTEESALEELPVEEPALEEVQEQGETLEEVTEQVEELPLEELPAEEHIEELALEEVTEQPEATEAEQTEESALEELPVEEPVLEELTEQNETLEEGTEQVEELPLEELMAQTEEEMSLDAQTDEEAVSDEPVGEEPVKVENQNKNYNNNNKGKKKKKKR
ncbi:MAG: hypothetical protein K2G31_00145 [Clostridia bacterium]|nr:hypothetical protein [Clostridia bacterium]